MKASWTRSRQWISRIAEAGLDAETLRWEIIAELRRAIGFDLWCWPLVDPASNLPTTSMGELAFWPELPRLLELKEADRGQHSETALLHSRDHTRVLSKATEGDRARSIQWREVLGPAGVGDELQACLVDGGEAWGWLHLFRAADDRPFHAQDAYLVTEVNQVVAGALRHAVVQPPCQPTTDELPVGVLVVDEGLRATAQTAATCRWLEAIQPTVIPYLLPTPGFAFQLAARILHGGLDGSIPGGHRVRLRTKDGRWVVAEGQLLEGGGRSVVITLRQAAPKEVFDLVCRGYDLSARESQVAALVVQGLDTAGIARKLFLSQYTVNDHLRSIFRKTGVRSRRELVSAIA